jgi:hypothetical protein
MLAKLRLAWFVSALQGIHFFILCCGLDPLLASPPEVHCGAQKIRLPFWRALASGRRKPQSGSRSAGKIPASTPIKPLYNFERSCFLNGARNKITEAAWI